MRWQALALATLVGDWARQGRSIVLASHRLDWARQLTDRSLVLDAGVTRSEVEC